MTGALDTLHPDESKRVLTLASNPAVSEQTGSPIGRGDPRDVTLRVASSRDARGLERLAHLDSASAPAAPTLVAEVDDEVVAALPLEGGNPVADPFRATADLVRLLELRAAQISRNGHRWRLWRRRR